MLFKFALLLVLYVSWTEAIIFNAFTVLGIWVGSSTAPILFFKHTQTGYDTIAKVAADGLTEANGQNVTKGQMLEMTTNGNCPVLCLKSGDIYSAVIYPVKVGTADKYVSIGENGAYKPDTGSRCMEWKALDSCQPDNCEFYNAYKAEFGKNCANFLVKE